MRSILVIINPIAGVRPKDEIPALVHKILPESEGFDVEIRFTERAGHASEMAKEAVEKGIDTVVAIGGDGTINETGRSLIGSDVKFGIVPMGSGNGLARHIQVPLDIHKALECIRDGYYERVDYGTVNDHIFFCTAGVGFDAEVSAKFAEAGTRGPITYVRSFMQLVGDYKPSTYIIHTDDGRVKEKAVLIAIGNASQWGNNAFITPQASMTDGVFDVTLIKPLPFIDIPKMTLQLFSRELDQNPHVLTFRSSHLRIFMPHASAVHVDGEPMQMEGVIDIQIHPKQLNIICPEHPDSSVLEPIRYAFEDIHYSIQGNIKKGVKQLEEFNKPVIQALEEFNKPVIQAAEQLTKPLAKTAEQLTKPLTTAAEQITKPMTKAAESLHITLFKRKPSIKKPKGAFTEPDGPNEEPMQEP